MYWWYRAAELVAAGASATIRPHHDEQHQPAVLKRESRRVSLGAEAPLSIIFAVPDHPWVDSADGAAVRVAMTVSRRSVQVTESLVRSRWSHGVDDERSGSSRVESNDREDSLGPAHRRKRRSYDALRSELRDLVARGSTLDGAGFLVGAGRAGAPCLQTSDHRRRRSRRIVTAKGPCASQPESVLVIDFVRRSQKLRLAARTTPRSTSACSSACKPERRPEPQSDHCERTGGIFGEDAARASAALARVVRATSSPPRPRSIESFVFLSATMLPDNKLVRDRARRRTSSWSALVASSRQCGRWPLAGRLGVGNDPRYTKTTCFDPFPFPVCALTSRTRIRQLGEQLDAHRKRQQAAHPGLDDHGDVQRAREAAGGRGAHGEGAGHPRAGAGVGAEADPRRARRGGVRRRTAGR